MKRYILLIVAMLTGAVCFSFGCGGGGGGGSSTTGSILGAVLLPGGGVWTGPKVTITANGTTVATSNTQGWYFSDTIPTGDRVVICYSATGYVKTCKIATIEENVALSTPDIRMLAVHTAANLANVENGGTITDPDGSGASITFPANSVCASDRETPVTGTITCSLTPIDVTTAAGIVFAPGDFTGVNSDGDSGILDSSGMMDISCTKSGTAVNLCNDKTATIVIPINGTCADNTINPPTIASWSFNESTGDWEEYATLTKNCAGGASEYSGKADHLSWWNADVWSDLTCLTATVVDGSGDPVNGAKVDCNLYKDTPPTIVGATSSAYSAADGTVRISAKPQVPYSCVAKKGTSTGAETQTGTTPAAGTTCKAIGNFTLSNPTMRTALTWGSGPPAPQDLDSYTMNSDHSINVNYTAKGSLTSAPFIQLDTDDTDWSGPEITTIMPQATAGTYYFCVHNFSGSSADISDSQAVVNVMTNTTTKTYSVPTSNPDNYLLWRVYSVALSSGGTPTITEINELVDAGATPETMYNACAGR